jgi:hypothetical protein
MNTRTCAECSEAVPLHCFRAGRNQCVWCQFAEPEVRARWRYKDKCRQPRWSSELTQELFVRWYLSQPDCCSYCGVTYNELRRLQLPRLKGYYVSWDIDRKDSSRDYELGNLALACVICNIAKSSYLSEAEARIMGRAVREVYNQRLERPSAT